MRSMLVWDSKMIIEIRITENNVFFYFSVDKRFLFLIRMRDMTNDFRTSGWSCWWKSASRVIKSWGKVETSLICGYKLKTWEIKVTKEAKSVSFACGAKENICSLAWKCLYWARNSLVYDWGSLLIRFWRWGMDCI